MPLSEVLILLAGVVGFTVVLFIVLQTVAPLMNAEFRHQRQVQTDFCLEPNLLKKLLPDGFLRRHDAVAKRIMGIYAVGLPIGVALTFALPDSAAEPPIGWGARIFMACFIAFPLVLAVVGCYSIYVGQRCGTKLCECRFVDRSPDNKRVKRARRVVVGLYLVMCLYYISSRSSDVLFGNPWMLIAIITIAAIYGAGFSKHNRLCANGIKTPIGFVSWDDVEWCRWYPEDRGVLIGANESVPFDSWFVIPLPEDIRGMFAPFLKEKLADKEIASVAEVLGLDVAKAEEKAREEVVSSSAT